MTSTSYQVHTGTIQSRDYIKRCLSIFVPSSHWVHLWLGSFPFLALLLLCGVLLLLTSLMFLVFPPLLACVHSVVGVPLVLVFMLLLAFLLLLASCCCWNSFVREHENSGLYNNFLRFPLFSFSLPFFPMFSLHLIFVSLQIWSVSLSYETSKNPHFSLRNETIFASISPVSLRNRKRTTHPIVPFPFPSASVGKLLHTEKKDERMLRWWWGWAKGGGGAIRR
jgi:hypothetical protein